MNKVIHCIWLGGEKTKLAQKCRASWERFAPDWTIKEWDEIPAGAPKYVQDALAARKWAFASDWLRFWILEKEGGVYLDYDVELVAPFEKLPEGEWCAAEWMKHGEWGYNPGSGIALEAGSRIACNMLMWYAAAEFGTEKTVGDVMREFLGPPEFAEGVRILPPEVMSPTDWHGKVRRNENTIAIHHYALSWITSRRRFARWLSWHGFDWMVQALLKIRG